MDGPSDEVVNEYLANVKKEIISQKPTEDRE